MRTRQPQHPSMTDLLPAHLRGRVCALLTESAESIVEEAVALLPFRLAGGCDSDLESHLEQLLVKLLAAAIATGPLEGGDALIADLYQLSLDRRLSTERLFALVHLVERRALETLALSDGLGGDSDSWSLVTAAVRRGSFDVLAAYTERALIPLTSLGVTDRPPTLYTRPIFEAALVRELERSKRFGYDLSIILFDVDRLSEINETHGYGVGDRILEQLGVLIWQYFRRHDWVAVHADDSIAVLLPRTDVVSAIALAERVRVIVEERLAFTDRTNRAVPITVSAAVVHSPVSGDESVDPEALIAQAEAAIARAKRDGRNRVELGGPLKI